MKFDHKLLIVEAIWQFPRLGLIVIPFFPFPKSGEGIDYSTKAKVVDPHKEEKVHKIHIGCCHFDTFNPKINLYDRSRIFLIFPEASEEQIPIGSEIFLTKEDFNRVKGKIT